jgi:hypothetical protein
MNPPPTPLTLAARFPGLRALAWSEHHLYASRGYELLRANVEDARDITWQPVAHFRPSLRRRLSASNRFSARLFRDGFHALAFLPSAAIIGAVPSSIVMLGPGESEFRQPRTKCKGIVSLESPLQLGVSRHAQGTVVFGVGTRAGNLSPGARPHGIRRRALPSRSAHRLRKFPAPH